MSKRSDDSHKSSHWLTLLVGAAAGAIGGYFLHKALNTDQAAAAETTDTPGLEIRSFLCPITQEIMSDPWACPHCQSFERSAIVDWLSRSPSCPLCGRTITVAELRPNLNLKSAIEEYRRLHQSTK